MAANASSDRMPVWFLAHGAPSHLLGEQPVREFWQSLPEKLTRQPRAVLCLSAHWLTEVPSFAGDVPSPQIQYDFAGFPDELYQIQWPLKGNPETAKWLKSSLKNLLPELEVKETHPFDHGVWVPLMTAWPEPDFPVYQLSLCPQQGTKWHIDLGKQLAVLRDKGVLIIGSGGIVHNLSKINWQAPRGNSTDWAADFMQAVKVAMLKHDYAALSEPWSLPYGKKCVPTIEHYLPLLIMLGACLNEEIIPLYEDWEYGSLNLHSYTSSE